MYTSMSRGAFYTKWVGKKKKLLIQGGSPVIAGTLFCWANILFVQSEEPATRHVYAKKKEKKTVNARR